MFHPKLATYKKQPWNILFLIQVIIQQTKINFNFWVFCSIMIFNMILIFNLVNLS